jgi:chromosomal replication initiator protein
LLVTPENQAALTALQDVLVALITGRADRLPYPLYLFGASGCGKSHIVEALADEVARCQFNVTVLSARDLTDEVDWPLLAQTDLFILEDLQHLAARNVEKIIVLLDERQRLQAPSVLTALGAPNALARFATAMPRRLLNRLVGGLVVPLAPMQAASRRRLLDHLARDAKATVSAEILDWLAKHLVGGGRQLAGAVAQMKTLQALQKNLLTVDNVRAHFRAQIEATAPTVERITEHVSACYRVKPRVVQSAQRSRDALLPRQVSMYLARQLTTLSLAKIGQHFGGRDHKTVDHACRKVARAMKADPTLFATVRQLGIELT